MALISLIHPSRGRPEKSWTNSLMNWFRKAGSDDVELIVSLDYNDNCLKEYKLWYKAPQNYTMIVNNNNSVVEATNKAAAIANGEILIYLSDDFNCFHNWAHDVLKEFENEDRPLLLKVDDCLQNFHVPVLTIPMMNRALYNKLGYFFHPGYKSMFVDQDLFEVCRKMNCIKYAPHLKFPHEHVSIGKAPDDETYRRSAANWNQGEQLFLKRKAAGFPV